MKDAKVYNPPSFYFSGQCSFLLVEPTVDSFFQIVYQTIKTGQKKVLFIYVDQI